MRMRARWGIACLLGLSLATTGPRAQSAPDAQLPVKFATTLQSLSAGKAVRFDEHTQLFAAGIADVLMSQCGLPANAGEKATIMPFLVSMGAIVAAGTRYSDRSLDKTLGSQATANAIYVIGARTAQDYSCTGPQARNMASAIARSITLGQRGKDGGPSAYAQSCSRRFNATQCTCLAGILQTVIPEIHGREYSSDQIKYAIESNPFLGLQIGIQCQIGDY